MKAKRLIMTQKDTCVIENGLVFIEENEIAEGKNKGMPRHKEY